MTADATGPVVLVDSSVWIEFYRPDGRESLREEVSDALVRDVVATAPLIVTEVARGAPDRGTLDALLSDFSALPCLGEDRRAGAEAARIGHTLRERGTPVPATDLLVAATALGGGCELWHQHIHFERIGEVSDLRQRAF